MKKIDFNKKLETIRTQVIGAITGVLSRKSKQPTDCIEQVLGDGEDGAFVCVDEYDDKSDTPYQEPVNIVKVTMQNGHISFLDDCDFDRSFDDFNLHALIGIYETMMESEEPVNKSIKD